MIPAKATKVVVTKHAIQRARERMRLFLKPFEYNDPSYISFLLEKEFRSSYLDMRIENCPSWKNQLAIKYGQGAFKSYGKNFGFFGKYDIDKGVVVVKTVVSSKNCWRDKPF